MLRWIFPLYCCLLCSVSLTGQIVNIEELRIRGTNDTTRWYGHLGASAAVMKVSQQSIQFNADAQVQYKKDPHLLLWLLNGSLLRAGSQDFARQLFGHFRYNYKISQTWTAEAFVQTQTNPLQLLRNRSLTGAGLRWRALKSSDGRQRLYLGAATLMEWNQFSEPYGKEYRNRFSSYLSITLHPGKHTLLYGTTYWQPVWGLIHNYRMSSDWNLQLEISKRLSFTAAYTYNFDNNLPETATKSTYVWRNGLLWHF